MTVSRPSALAIQYPIQQPATTPIIDSRVPKGRPKIRPPAVAMIVTGIGVAATAM